MNGVTAPSRAREAIEVLEMNRAEVRALLAPVRGPAVDAATDVFPRSQTIRWLLRHPIGRWVGSAFMTTVLARFPLGRLANMCRASY